MTLLLRVRGNTAVERRALARRREFDAFVSDLVVAAAEEGDLRPGIDPALTSRLVFGTVNSLIEWYRPRTGGTVADLADAVVELTFDGCAAPDHRGPHRRAERRWDGSSVVFMTISGCRSMRTVVHSG